MIVIYLASMFIVALGACCLMDVLISDISASLSSRAHARAIAHFQNDLD